MSEVERKVLTENELADIGGGRERYKTAHRVGMCVQCAIEGHMNIDLYKTDDMLFCRDVGHIYQNGKYAYTNKREIADIECVR